mgnify:CR=1 FL=1
MSEKKRPVSQLKSLIIQAMWDDKQYLLGRVLTIVDASIADQTQRKAMKDIIQDAFWGTEGRGWMIKEILAQFADRFVKESVMFQTEDEREEFIGGYDPKTPKGEKVEENFFPEN